MSRKFLKNGLFGYQFLIISLILLLILIPVLIYLWFDINILIITILLTILFLLILLLIPCFSIFYFIQIDDYGISLNYFNKCLKKILWNEIKNIDKNTIIIGGIRINSLNNKSISFLLTKKIKQFILQICKNENLLKQISQFDTWI